ncbi:MAG TPA: anti-sigma F factor antagonist [Firmicutes bacterium]|jgi:stage II sporulation protein AA (anti-sigma F factor antagonist)|nr:anti-sigma F factor antagonist [Bacillota bacterium]HAA34437.1 anti-sigma F factor antagonist [Bacillota bacterium]
MQVQIIRRKKNLIVRLKGELDHHTSLTFRQAVEKELEKEIIQNLIINMENLTFMDSSGIGAILGRYKQFRDRGGKVVICGLSRHNKKILEMGGLLKIIPVCTDERQALENLS